MSVMKGTGFISQVKSSALPARGRRLDGLGGASGLRHERDNAPKHRAR